MLVALWDVSNQFNDNNGSILTNGKIYVYYSGRAALAPTWSSADGSHVNPNPIILDNNGRAVAFADDQYTYTCVVCDFYGKELFSFDPASFGTGGGGSTTEGNDAAHWIGASGTDVQVTAQADTLLPLPSSPDYEGDFVGQTTYTTISLNKGLYMVDADIRIQQDDDDLENIIKDISVYTGLTGPDSLTTSQKNWTGPEASDDRHFVHVHFIRHIADEGEDLYFQMNSPVDLSQAWIEKLSIVKLTEGGNGKNYVGGYGIDITGPVISVSGMIPEASAANFVDVGTYNTDITNIYEAIAETSGQIPSGVATQDWVTDYTSAFITSADLPDLSDYATQQWVEDQHYITSADIPDIPEDVVTSGELATVSGEIVNQIPSLDGYATEQWVGEQGYLTSVPSEYVTQSEMEDYTSAFITSADIPDIPEDLVTSAELASTSAELESMIPSLDGYATEQYVQDYTSAFITSADVPAQVTYTATSPIAIDASNNISLKYGNTLILTNSSTTDTVETNNYGDIAWQITGEPTETDNLQISSPGNLSIRGDTGNHLRLRIDLDDTDTNYINSKVNLLSGSQEITLDGTQKTIYGFQTPAGSTWATIFDFSVHPISDMYASQAVYGSVLVELWEYNGDTPVRAWYGGPYLDWPEFYTIQFTSSESGLNVANPLPSPGNIPNYVLTSNGTGGSYWAPAGDIPDDIVTSGQLATVSGEIVNQIPDTSDMATKTWVNQQGFITSLPEDLVTSGELATVSGNIMNEIPSLDGYATEEYVQDNTSAFITEDALNGYATEQWVGDQGYLTSVPAEYATSADLATVSGQMTKVRTYTTNGGYWPIVGVDTDYKILRFNYGATGSPSLSNVMRIVEVSNGSTYTTLGELVPVPSTSGLVLTSLTSSGMSWKEPSGGSEVDIIPSLQTGTKIADYVIDGTSGALYAPAGGGGSTYYAGDHIVIDQNNYISTSGLMVENSAFMIDSAGYANRVTDGGAAGTLNLGTISGNDPLQVTGMQDDVEYTLNCSGNTDGVQIYQGQQWDYQSATTKYPTNNEIKFTKSDFDNISSTGNYYLHFVNAWSGLIGNNATLSYGGSGITNTRYALVDQLPTSGQLMPSGGLNGQVVTNVAGSPVWANPSFHGIYSSPIGTTPNTVEVVTSLPVSPVAGRIYLIPES